MTLTDLYSHASKNEKSFSDNNKPRETLQNFERKSSMLLFYNAKFFHSNILIKMIF